MSFLKRHQFSERFTNFLRYFSIRQRLFFGFVIVPLCVLMIFFIAYDYISSDMVIKKNEEQSGQLLNMIEENFNLNINKFEQQFDEVMAYDAMYSSILEANAGDEVRLQEVNTQLNYLLDSKTHFLSNAYEISAYTKDGKLAYSRGTKVFSSDIVQTQSLASAEANGKTVWFHTVVDKEGVIGLTRAMYRKGTNTINGYVFIALKENAFTALFNSEESTSNKIVIMDRDNRYLFGQLDIPRLTYIDDSTSKYTIDLTNYSIQSQTIANVPWKVANLVDQHYILNELNTLRVALLLYSLAIVGILVLIMGIIYRSFYDPLEQVLTSMKSIDDKHLGAHIKDTGYDEVHELVENYNSLVDRIQELLVTVETQQTQKREAEIKMLQAQINPHFLFNTLNTLRSLAIINNDKPLSKGIAALAKLLRNTITDSKEMMEVVEEIENVKNYIIIQKLRYGNLFDTEFDIQESVKHEKIMKFLLQPIVENSILHGFEEDRDNQLLMIRVYKQQEELIVEIEDNGKGFKTEEQKDKHKGNLSGIGMRNIQERIQLTYGEIYHMQIDSTLNVGTKVTLHLPLCKEKEEDSHVSSNDCG